MFDFEAVDWTRTLQSFSLFWAALSTVAWLLWVAKRHCLEKEVARYKLQAQNAVAGWDRSLVQVQKMPHAVALAFRVRDCRPFPEGGKLVSPEYVQAWTEFCMLARELSSKSPQDFYDELLKL